MYTFWMGPAKKGTGSVPFGIYASCIAKRLEERADSASLTFYKNLNYIGLLLWRFWLRSQRTRQIQ